MNLTVQGKPLDYDGEANLKALIEKMNGQPLYCTVRVNGEVQQRRDFENMPVADGDRVDLLYFMGGGAAAARRRRIRR
jgi:sulfur carrier protein